MPHSLAAAPAVDLAIVGGLSGVATRLRALIAPGATPSMSAPTPPASGCDHRELHTRLAKLPDSIFEEILFHAPIERRHIAPPAAPLATRILEVAQRAAVDPNLCQRLARLLDERAPWTR